MGNATCTFLGCTKRYHAQGLCKGHYSQRFRGQALRPIGPLLSPPPDPVPGAIWIPLAGGRFALIDDCDWHLLQHRWHVRREAHGFYVFRNIRTPGGRRTARMLHRDVLGLTDPSIQADHIDGNGLDNRRANLRAASGYENAANRRKPRTNRSGFKGVTWSTAAGRWQASITVAGRHRHIGTFSSAEDAARAFDAAARDLQGSFARVNFPRDGERSA